MLSFFRATRGDISFRLDAVHGPAPTSPIAVDEVVARFLDGTLPRDAWTHAAHLWVCDHLLRSASPDEVLEQLRTMIPAHNERVGVLPYHGGYHETITRYFVGAVAAAKAPTTAALLTDPACQRDSPLRHWSPEALGSPEARTTWVAPDRAPLRWSAPT